MSEMLEPISLYHSPSPRILSTPSASPKPSTHGVVARPQRAADSLSDPLSESQPPSTPSGSPENPTSSPKVKAKRAARACDVCRKSSLALFHRLARPGSLTAYAFLLTRSEMKGNNHRKCPGPAPGSESCQRCIRQHKVCTWNEHKARMARQASASPRTTKTRKVFLPRSKSVPAVQLISCPQTSLPPSDISARASSPVSSTSDEGLAPTTPADDCNAHPSSSQKDANAVPLVGAPRASTTSHAPESSRQQAVQAQALPEWYTDTLAVANKHNLLFFPMCLDSWEERHLREHHGSVPNVGLQCVVPSYIDPPPTPNEAMDMLDLLLLEMRTFPNASLGLPRPGATTGVETVSFPKMVTEKLVSSDEEPYPRVESDDSASDRTASDPVGSSPSPLPPAPPAERTPDLLVTAEDDDLLSEPEPEFSFDTSTDSSSRDTVPPQRLKSEPAGFDPFLYSPYSCLTAPAQAIGTSPMSEDTNESSIDGAQKLAQALWDEGMPDVLTDASNEAALEQCLRIGETLSLD